MQAAISELEIKLASLENNEPIFRKEGNVLQANACRQNAFEIREALSFLEGTNEKVELTEGELLVLKHLADAWNSYITLPRIHQDHTPEFKQAIHLAQYLIAVRVAGRVDTQVWTDERIMHERIRLAKLEASLNGSVDDLE